MFEIEAHILVHRPVDEVFGFVADFENAPKWQTGVVQSKRASEGALRVGTRFEEDVRILGRHVPTVCIITEFDSPRTFTFKSTSSGVVEYGARFTFTPVDGGTHVDLKGTAQLKGLWRLVEPLFARETKTEVIGEMEAIRNALETEAQAVGAV